MDYDAQLQRYFGTTDLDAVSPAVLEDGKDRLRVEFGMETDPGRRFAMWALMYILGIAPDLDVAFKDPAEQDAARNFMDLMAASFED